MLTATDPAGNALAPVAWTFTSADVTAPTVANRTPAPGATDVSAATTVTATFSEPVQAATVQKLEEIILTRARDLRRAAIPG